MRVFYVKNCYIDCKEMIDRYTYDVHNEADFGQGIDELIRIHHRFILIQQHNQLNMYIQWVPLTSSSATTSNRLQWTDFFTTKLLMAMFNNGYNKHLLQWSSFFYIFLSIVIGS